MKIKNIDEYLNKNMKIADNLGDNEYKVLQTNFRYALRKLGV